MSLACPHYTGEFWKRSFISAVRPTIHTNPSRKQSFISTVRPPVHTKLSRKHSFISTVRPTVHTNPSRKRSFLKTLFKPEESENNRFKFKCGSKTFSDNHNHVTPLTDRVFVEHKSKITSDCCVLNSSSVVSDKQSLLFQTLSYSGVTARNEMTNQLI